MSLLSNIAGAAFSTQQRWFKLYRTIHHLFLKDEIVHVEDFKLMLEQLNARIAAVELSSNVEMQKMAAVVKSHVHPGVTSGGATTAPTVSPIVPIKSQTLPVKYIDGILRSTNLAFQAAGPSNAPLSLGYSTEEMVANQAGFTDIGLV